MSAPTVLLAASGVRFGYAARPNFLGPIDLTIETGQRWAIIGPNGAGKSTLVRLLAGLRTPHGGSITLAGEPLRRLGAQERARRIAFLPQHLPVDLNLLVREVVLMGRFPHRRFGLFESPEDEQIARAAMQTTQTLEYADRLLSTLSGGEAQRVHLAAALAQQPELLILDEPTTGLDLFHQVRIYEILRDLSRGAAGGGSDCAVVVVTHDVNLAARYCTRVLLLHDGAMVAAGAPAAVVRPEVLEPVYRVALASLGDGAGRGWIVPS